MKCLSHIGFDGTLSTATCLVVPYVPCRGVDGQKACRRVTKLVIDGPIDDGGRNLGRPQVRVYESVT
jgi:hypothetical protein